jgi:hypothetical protein
LDLLGRNILDSRRSTAFPSPHRQYEIRRLNAGILVAATSVFVGDPAIQPPNWAYQNLIALVNIDDTEAGRVAGTFAAERLPA